MGVVFAFIRRLQDESFLSLSTLDRTSHTQQVFPYRTGKAKTLLKTLHRCRKRFLVAHDLTDPTLSISRSGKKTVSPVVAGKTAWKGNRQYIFLSGVSCRLCSSWNKKAFSGKDTDATVFRLSV